MRDFTISSQRGFTLVELSIVLVILGLLVGGVLTGQSLIRAAELRSITTQYNNYRTALNAFKDKYFAVPGDMPNATSFWGVAAAGATCITTIGTGTQTCDGDGDGIITLAGATSNEVFRFWQHLANAGLIEGRYLGVTQGSTTYSATADNTPRGKRDNSLWFTFNWGTWTNAGVVFDGNYINTIEFGGKRTNTDASGPMLLPEEVWNIDTKIDDGKPATGKLWIRSIYGISACTDTSTTTNYAANYLLSNTNAYCVLMFPQSY